jgi:hypothetical protein
MTQTLLRSHPLESCRAWLLSQSCAKSDEEETAMTQKKWDNNTLKALKMLGKRFTSM